MVEYNFFPSLILRNTETNSPLQTLAVIRSRLAICARNFKSATLGKVPWWIPTSVSESAPLSAFVCLYFWLLKIFLAFLGEWSFLLHHNWPRKKGQSRQAHPLLILPPVCWDIIIPFLRSLFIPLFFFFENFTSTYSCHISVINNLPFI